MKDPYKVLGVSPNVDEKAVKKAYHKLAHKYHPDKNPDDKKAEEQFKEVNDAYQQITNPQPKTDAFPGYGYHDNVSSTIFDEIFKGFNGGGVNYRSRANAPLDIKVATRVTFKEACFGVTKDITFSAEDYCGKCNGKGAPAGKFKTCMTCNGTGHKQKNYRFVTMSGGPCTDCKGKGTVFEETCTDCTGKGTKRKSFTKQVKIPPCVASGQSLIIRGGGSKGKNGRHSNLYVNLSVEQDASMVRDGINITSRTSIPLREALLGTQVSVETLHGPMTVKVSECTKQNAKLRLSSKGAKVPNQSDTTYGDHIVIIDIEFPEKLTDKQKEIIKEL